MNQKRGASKKLVSIRNYVHMAAPEPEVLRILGEESKRRGTIGSPDGTLIERSKRRARRSALEPRSYDDCASLVLDTNILVSAPSNPMDFSARFYRSRSPSLPTLCE